MAVPAGSVLRAVSSPLRVTRAFTLIPAFLVPELPDKRALIKTDVVAILTAPSALSGEPLVTGWNGPARE